MTGVAIFVKTPGFSPVKTRLAATRGQDFAETWYLQSAAKAGDTVKESACDGYWAVAEDDPAAHDAWPGLPTLSQGGGGLGERMGRVHTELVGRHGSGVLVGADCPQMTADMIRTAADWLSGVAPRLVMGPSIDGGFWLFGANRVLPMTDWAAVAYSQTDTAKVFRARMSAYGDWLELATLRDVDVAEDLDA